MDIGAKSHSPLVVHATVVEYLKVERVWGRRPLPMELRYGTLPELASLQLTYRLIVRFPERLHASQRWRQQRRLNLPTPYSSDYHFHVVTL